MDGQLWFSLGVVALCLIVIVGCNRLVRLPPDPPQALPLPPPAAPSPLLATQARLAADAVHKRYQDALTNEPGKVLSAWATADFVTRVHAADREAREALKPLEGSAVPSKAAIERARRAVDALHDVLSEGDQPNEMPPQK